VGNPPQPAGGVLQLGDCPGLDAFPAKKMNALKKYLLVDVDQKLTQCYIAHFTDVFVLNIVEVALTALKTLE